MDLKLGMALDLHLGFLSGLIRVRKSRIVLAAALEVLLEAFQCALAGVVDDFVASGREELDRREGLDLKLKANSKTVLHCKLGLETHLPKLLFVVSDKWPLLPTLMSSISWAVLSILAMTMFS